MIEYGLWKISTVLSKFQSCLISQNRDSVIIFDTSMCSNNKGDQIISFYCNKVLEECIGSRLIVRVPTHQLPTEEELAVIRRTRLKIVCGTNILSPDFENWSLWKMPNNLSGYTNIIAFGIGWGYYSNGISDKSKTVYRHIFSKKYLHSVRDSYTEKKLKQIGINNVVNTSCPTMWGLTPEVSAAIPHGKAKNVVMTITDYSRDYEADNYLIETLSRHYEKVYIWLQGSKDSEYLASLHSIHNLIVVPGGINAFSEILLNNDIDYIGTRLHAGIHALNMGVRSMIIAIDNRAVEISRDTSLPIIPRKQIMELLPAAITESRETRINLPWDSIHQWKTQFFD